MTQETLQRQLAGLISTLEFRPSAEHPEACMPMAAAVLALTQSASEVPTQRDERAEKLGEQLDAMVAEVNVNHRIIGRLEERVRNAEALAANLKRLENEGAIELMRVKRDLAAARAEILTDDALLAERQCILDALPCPEHGACVPYVLDVLGAAGKLVQAAKRVLSGSDFLEGTQFAMDELGAAVSDPALAAWRGK